MTRVSNAVPELTALPAENPLLLPAGVGTPERRYAMGIGAVDSGGGSPDYLRLLWRKKWLVLLCAVGAAVIAVLATLPQKRKYTPTVTIEIQPINSDFLNMSKLTPVAQTDAHDVNPLGDIPTQIEILGSQTLIDRVAMHFDKEYVVKRHGAGGASSSSSLMERVWAHFSSGEGSVDDKWLDMAIDSLKAKAIPETRVVKISCVSTSPQQASDFLNLLAEEYIKQSLEVRWSMNQRTQEWLRAQLEDMRVKLEQSETSLQSYARNAGLLVADDSGSKVSEAQLLNIQQELSKAQADRAVQEARYEIARRAPAETLADVIDDQTLRQYRSRETELQQQVADLESTYTAGSPKVQRTLAQLAEVKAAFAQERDALIARIGNDFEQAKRRERLLRNQYDLQSQRVSADAEHSVQFNVLHREVDSNRQLYDSMIQQVKQASIASAINASNVRVIDRAEAPLEPSAPKRSLYGIGGFVFGGLLGMAFALRREISNRTFRHPCELRDYLGVPELGAIPAMRSVGRKSLPVTEPASENPEKSPMAIESFRALLTSILFADDHGSRPRIILISSVNPGEGKSFVAMNLAQTCADSGHTVLLIDADMRKPEMHRSFGISNTEGLSTLLAGSRTEQGDGFRACIRTTLSPNLAVITSGPPTNAGVSLLYSRKLVAMLQTVREEYDLVLIDSPPLLAMPDARVLGRLSDGVVLVVRSGVTSRQAVQMVHQRLEADGSAVLGTILNDWCPEEYEGYGYSYGYRYGYSYTSTSENDEDVGDRG